MYVVELVRIRMANCLTTINLQVEYSVTGIEDEEGHSYITTYRNLLLCVYIYIILYRSEPSTGSWKRNWTNEDRGKEIKIWVRTTKIGK